MARRTSLVACKNCGTLVPRGSKVCPECGSTQFTENWSGMLVIIDPENSAIARELGIEKPVRKAILIGKKVMI
ncbi:DNA-directed RNA polymerase subunit E [Aeropyrum pernix K1]|uniref:Transcription elongation factor Spt4 n=2 Tax=Aeropyrum pernix TaxID=56636 RepID=Q9YFJ1_AERPE|nr:transcription elongation factor subunit Spt4 [Aeropyrum pernix]BAA79170.2 DNA-directed RNA polymerase subunit E [Aeropyrum pernix K1]GBF08373.1 DNA-directed RNA polymerase subunit E [Aeropyrum pernix]